MSSDGDHTGPENGDPRQTQDARWRASGAKPASPPPPYAPQRPTGAARFFGGNPAGVLLRLVLLSIVVGVLFAVFGFNPGDLVRALRDIVRLVFANSAELIESLVRYFLLGAAIVFPIWLILRLVSMAGRR